MYRDVAKEPQTAPTGSKSLRVRLPSRRVWERMEPAERVAIAEASDGLIDPRIAKRGGYRTNSKSHYEFPGMQDRSSWRRSAVHAATSFYGCSLCGQKFVDPHAVYTHLAKVHDR